MSSDQNDGPFLMTVEDSFGVTAYELSVIGAIQSGVVRPGDWVEVVRSHKVVASAKVSREVITENHALILCDLSGDWPQPGDAIRVGRQ